MKMHQNSVFADSFCTSLQLQNIGFFVGEHSDNKKVPISVLYFSSSRCMPIFSLVGKVFFFFLVFIKSTSIMSFPALTINKTPL